MLNKKRGIPVFLLIFTMILSALTIPKVDIVYAEDEGQPKTEEIWRHFKSGEGNNNADKPALLKNSDEEIDNLSDGSLSFTFRPLSTKADTRFGIYLRYKDANNFVFVGVDNSSNWFYEYKVNGSGSYPKLNVNAPQQGEDAKIDLKWEGKNLYIAINGTPLNGGNAYTIDALETLQDHPLRLRAGTWGTVLTDIIFKDVVIKDGSDTVLAENGTDQWEVASTGGNEVYEHEYKVPIIHEVEVTGKVVDHNGDDVANAKVVAGSYTTQTLEDGTFKLDAVKTGTYTVTASKPGSVSASKDITVTDSAVDVGTLQLGEEGDIEVEAPAEIKSSAMKVGIDDKFPRAIIYEMTNDFAGSKFYGQTETLDTIKINGVAVKPEVIFSQTEDTATYIMKVKDDTNNIDAELTAKLIVEGNSLTFKITDIKDTKIVKTIEIPGHGLITTRNTQTNASFAGANMSTNTHKSGDVFSSVDQMAVGKTGYMFGFLSTSSLSAGIWSNSENKVTSDWQRITAETKNYADYKAIELSSTYWTYQKDSEYRKQNTEDEMPCVKVVLTGDINDDSEVDWQDGAIAYRDIMKDPQGAELVPDRVAIRIAMNFGSMAQNPFLMTLDNVKKVYLNTDGLGQSILLKGYGSEGHDSGHLNYADIGSRIGGTEDMKYLLDEGQKYGATFGVHVNASETYPESKYFTEDRLKKDANGGYSYGWNWLDQGINIDANYDLLNGRADRFKDFYDELGGADNNLDFIYVDVWGNGQSGDNGTWATSQLSKEITGLGWRVAGEWGYAFAYDSTFQHWAADLTYGGYNLKGINSDIARFIQNHQKDSWVGDYPSYGGAAINPLLGGYDMKDFEGWQGRNDYKGYMENLFDDNLASKFVQHFKVTNWENGTPVTMSDNDETYTWTPEMKVTLKDDTHKLVIERQSNDVSSAGYRLRTMTFDDKVIMNGETYLIPWFWDENGNTLNAVDEKLYHWNQGGGTTSWDVPAGWSGSVKIYELTEDGKQNEQTLSISGGKVTINAKAKTAYVLHKTTSENEDVKWSEGAHIVDTGFNSGNLDAWTIEGDDTKANVVLSQASNRMLAIGDNDDTVELTQKITDLTPGQQYAVYIGVDNRSDAKAYIEVDANGSTESNYTTRSIAKNYIQAYSHNTNNGTTGSSSYFQNMYVFFSAPTDGSDVILRIKRTKGDGLTYFDDIRVFENESNMYESDTKFVQDFENVPQGIFPFVVGGVEGVTDNRTHLSEANPPYTQRDWNGKAINDVIDGTWSLKTNGLVQRQKLVYQTIPQNYRFEPGETYTITFDYEVGSTGTYGLVIGDGEYTGNLKVIPLEETVSKGGAQKYSFRITGAASGQTWFGIYSTDVASNDQGSTGDDAIFRGYKDVILDNLVIEKSIASKTDLLELVESHEDLYKENYSESTWNDFVDTMDEAKAILDDPSSSQDTVDNMFNKLKKSIDDLEVIGSVVKGIVKDTDGNALKDIEVEIDIDGTKLTAVTNGSGKYEIPGVTFGERNITVGNKYFINSKETVTTSKTEQVVEKDFTLTRGTASVNGVITAVGKPLSSANVKISVGSTVLETVTDENGNYSFADVPANEYTIQVVAAESGYDMLSTKLELPNGKDVEKDLMVEPESTYDYVNDFDNGTTTWKDLAGNTSSTTIKAESGGTVIKFPGGHANVYDQAAPRFKNGVVEMDITAIKDSARLGVLLRANDMNNRVYVGTLENSSTWFAEHWGSGGNAWSSGHAGPSIKANTTVHIKVEIIEKTVKLWINDTLVLEETMNAMPLDVGSIGLNTRNSNEVTVDNVKVISYDEPTTEVKTVAGYISDNEQAVVGANVEITPVVKGLVSTLSAGKSTTTDANGNYKFKNMPYGLYTVTATFDGKEISKNIAVKDTNGYIVVEEMKFNEPVPPVDKQALKDAIDDAKVITSDGYTTDSWNALVNAIKEAEAEYNNSNATNESVATALSNLEAAVDGLKVISKDTLNGLITEVKALDESKYTEASWKVLQEALKEAINVSDDSTATEVEIDSAITKLNAAKAALKEVSKDELKSLIDSVKELKEKDYTADSWKLLSESLTKAIEIYDKENATEQEIEKAITELDKAINGLIEKETPKPTPDPDPKPDPGTDEKPTPPSKPNEIQGKPSDATTEGTKTGDITNINLLGYTALLSLLLVGYIAIKKKKEDR